jgi:hypothetical protein
MTRVPIAKNARWYSNLEERVSSSGGRPNDVIALSAAIFLVQSGYAVRFAVTSEADFDILQQGEPIMISFSFTYLGWQTRSKNVLGLTHSFFVLLLGFICAAVKKLPEGKSAVIISIDRDLVGYASSKVVALFDPFQKRLLHIDSVYRACGIARHRKRRQILSCAYAIGKTDNAPSSGLVRRCPFIIFFVKSIESMLHVNTFLHSTIQSFRQLLEISIPVVTKVLNRDPTALDADPMCLANEILFAYIERIPRFQFSTGGKKPETRFRRRRLLLENFDILAKVLGSIFASPRFQVRALAEEKDLIQERETAIKKLYEQFNACYKTIVEEFNYLSGMMELGT